MKLTIHYCLLLILVLAIGGCQSTKKDSKEPLTLIQIITTKGPIIVELYNETPKHRDNFIKIAKDGVLDSVLFHRVIENFMIQAGDPDSKNAKPGDMLGNGGLDYKVDAEFNAALFHKKGVLAAARDGNPERASSSTQFYIVQGKIYNDSLLHSAENRINAWLADHYTRKAPENKALVSALKKAAEVKNFETYNILNDSLLSIAKTSENFEHYTIPETHREVYKTWGGTPHLDQNYTVFGEVVEGLQVVDSIAKVPTAKFNRPVEDIRIIKVRVLE